MALSSARSSPPDLILLDIMMPEISGFDVCRQLKQDDKTKDIPVILQTKLFTPLFRLRPFCVRI